MRVKIGETWHDAKDEPICIELEPRDKEQIKNMADDNTKWAVFPQSFCDGKTNDELLAWME